MGRWPTSLRKKEIQDKTARKRLYPALLLVYSSRYGVAAIPDTRDLVSTAQNCLINSGGRGHGQSDSMPPALGSGQSSPGARVLSSTECPKHMAAGQMT